MGPLCSGVLAEGTLVIPVDTEGGPLYLIFRYAQVIPQTQRHVSYCQNCGKEIQSEWIRCPFCPTQPSQTKTLGKQISYASGSGILIFSLYVLFTAKYFEDAFFWMITPMAIGSGIILNAMMK